VKPLCTALALAGLLCIGGCAGEAPTGQEVQEQIGRGIRGEGQLSTDVDRTDDPYVRPREGAPPRRE